MADTTLLVHFHRTYRSLYKLPIGSTGFLLDSCTQRMELIGFPETSVRNYHKSPRYNPQQRSSQLLRGLSMKLHILNSSCTPAANIYTNISTLANCVTINCEQCRQNKLGFTAGMQRALHTHKAYTRQAVIMDYAGLNKTYHDCDVRRTNITTRYRRYIFRGSSLCAL